MSSVTLNSVTYNNLSFTNIDLTETDVGTVLPLVGSAVQPQGIDTATGAGINLGGVPTGAYYANSSEVLNLDYTVSASSGSLIDTASQLYVPNYFAGPGISLVAVENIYDTSGNLIGTDTFNAAASNPPVTLSEDVQTINVQITLTMAVDQTGNSNSGVVISGLQQSYGTVPAPPATASIGDIAFSDMAGTGIESGFDAGPGVAGVTVELLNSTGTTVLATTTTDANGLYNFSNLAAGVYEVAFVAPPGYSYSPELATNNPGVNSSADDTTGITGPITLTAGEADHDVEVGLVPTGSAAGGVASIGTTVWMDTNGNGLDDNGEQGVAGVTVDLLNGSGTIIATTTTNASGTYQFTNLNAGTYEVTFQAPTGDSFTTENVNPGTTGDLNSVANSAGQTALITLTAGETDNNVNAGLQVLPAAIGSTVWLDANRDGLDNNNEAGVAGVTVELLNATGTSVLATTTTNASGTYAFTGLTPGAYEVAFLAPTGDTFTTEGVPITGGAITNSSANSAGVTAAVTLTAGETDNNVNAGLQVLPAAIGSTVWLDANRDGLDNNNEAGVAGVTVELLNATGTSVLATTTTNASGTYAFTGLAPGAYEVAFLAPTGDTFTTEGVPITGGAITNSSANSAGVTAAVTLTAGETDNNVNAGLQVPPASIGDIVWLDTNKNGLLNSGEPGVAGVTVELLNGTGTSILATTTTNSSGGYNFANLNAGVYEVKFIAPTGDTFTTQGVGSNPAVNSSANKTTGITAPITLTAGQVDNNVEAGLENSSTISVLKQPSTMVVNQCGQVTYTFTVTNTGSSALTNIKIQDNIGTAANPDYITPTLVTTGTDGTLAAGASWIYTETLNQISCSQGNAGSICTTTSGSHLTSGCTAWLSSSFNPTSCANGATYKFQGVSCTISGDGVGSKPITVDCPDSVVTFSSSCKTATTVYNAATDCWVTTLPANSNPGSVFLTGVPLTIPNGSNLTDSNVTWTINDSSNNCGAQSVSWDASCTGYSSFNQNGLNGSTNYNDIGVKSCDTNSGYGSGSNCDTGSGNNGSSYSNNGNNWYSNGSSWQGSTSDCAGTPENQNTSNNCGSTSQGSGGDNGWGSSGGNSWGSSGDNGWGSSGGNGWGSSGDNNEGSNNNNNCGSSGSSNGGSCGDAGSATQNQGSVVGAADTVTVTATAAGNTTVTASDTKEVQVLASNSNISVGGSAPTGSLTQLYGTADTLEFTYTPGNTVSLKQVQSGLASVTGTNSNSMAFIEITNNANPFASGASIYFQGAVTSGEDIYADATTNVLTNTPIAGGHFSTTPGADIFAYVFSSQAAFKADAAPIQTMAYNTSGSQAMHIGDTIGSLSVIGFVGAKGGHLAA
jgi:protocatechuate 3,4-dioxygenase beta subunit